MHVFDELNSYLVWPGFERDQTFFVFRVWPNLISMQATGCA